MFVFVFLLHDCRICLSGAPRYAVSYVTKSTFEMYVCICIIILTGLYYLL